MSGARPSLEGLASALASRYRLDRELGQGGMATVYLAHDRKHDRDVALKVLRPELAAVLGRERFLAEIHLTAKLDHPHILTLIDSGESDGFLWYVVPYIRGESLRQKLTREKQLGVEEALAITKQVAAALDYAHHQGVIHRDIKPENILLHEGEAMLADFGIALAVKEAAGNRFTETGLSLGTPQYMSPEQATGDRQLDARSDVYSLAAVLYELLAGEPPHSGATVQAVIAKLMTERPTRLRVVRDTVPEGVDSAVARALAKVPADRFASTTEFVQALEAPAFRATRLRPSRRLLPILTGGAVLAAVAFVVLTRGTRGPPAALVHRQLTFSGTAGQPELSPDGKMVAYVSGGRRLMVQALDGGEPVTLVPDSRFLYSPRWTWDGLSIAFIMFRDSLSLAATYLVSAKGGSARKVVDDQTNFDTGPGIDSLVRAPAETNALEVIDLQSGGAVRKVPVPDSITVAAPGLRVSPGGRWVVYDGRRAVLLDLRGKHPSLIGLPQGSSYRWSAAGDALYFLSGPTGAVDLRRVPVDPANGRLGRPELVSGLPKAADFDLGRDGRIVYTSASISTQVQSWSITERAPASIRDLRALTEGTRSVGSAAISDDGNSVAYSRQHDTNAELEVVSFGGGEPRILATSPADEVEPSWSPDGSHLAFFRGDSLMVVALSSDANPKRIGTHQGIGPAAWTADGKTIAYLQSERGPVRIVDLATGQERSVRIPDSVGTTAWARAIVISPDGGEILISTVFKFQEWFTLWHLDLNGERWRHLRKPFGEWFPLRWNRDGSIYLRHDNAISTDYGGTRTDLWRMRGVDGEPLTLAPFPDLCGFRGRSISSDGRRMACTLGRTESDLYLAVPGK